MSDDYRREFRVFLLPSLLSSIVGSLTGSLITAHTLYVFPDFVRHRIFQGYTGALEGAGYLAMFAIGLVGIGIFAFGVPLALFFRSKAALATTGALAAILGAILGVLSFLIFYTATGSVELQKDAEFVRLILLVGIAFGGSSGLAFWWFARKPVARQRLD